MDSIFCDSLSEIVSAIFLIEHCVFRVWQQWVIENNTFVAMMMQEGDPCGDRFRSTKVSEIMFTLIGFSRGL